MPHNIQELHAKLLALQADPSNKGKGLNLEYCSNILEPLIDPHTKADTWLSDALVADYVGYQIASANQQDNVRLCELHPLSMTDKKLNGFAKKNKQANKIIWPILEGRHFYLLLIVYEDNQVYINALDGFNDKNTHNKYFDIAGKLADLLYPEAELQIMDSQMIPKQNNSRDCGVVACYFADHFIQKSVSDFNQWLQTHTVPSADPNAPYTCYRKNIAQVIYEGIINKITPKDLEVSVKNTENGQEPQNLQKPDNVPPRKRIISSLAQRMVFLLSFPYLYFSKKLKELENKLIQASRLPNQKQRFKQYLLYTMIFSSLLFCSAVQLNLFISSVYVGGPSVIGAIGAFFSISVIGGIIANLPFLQSRKVDKGIMEKEPPTSQHAYSNHAFGLQAKLDAFLRPSVSEKPILTSSNEPFVINRENATDITEAKSQPSSSKKIRPNP